MNRFYYILIVVIFFSCEEQLKVGNDYSDLDVNADIAYDVEMNYTDGGEKVMTLTAPVLERIQGNPQRDIFPEGILVEFYKDGKKVYATLTADYAERQPDQYLVTASDNVVFENVKGEKLETSQLNWNERKGTIYSDRFAKLSRPDEIIYGYGFKANQDFTDIEFSKTTGKKPVPQLEGVTGSQSSRNTLSPIGVNK